jgi:hypothetical protein
MDIDPNLFQESSKKYEEFEQQSQIKLKINEKKWEIIETRLKHK